MMDLLLLLLAFFNSTLKERRDLALENLALRQQLAVLKRGGKRPAIKKKDRLFWVWLSRIWKGWRESLVIVKPETVVGWHRKSFRLYWAKLSRRRYGGRPAVDPKVKALIEQMAESNPLWGAPRIHGELEKLGIEISERTVSRLISRRRKPPSQTWRTFIDNRIREMVSIDFLTVPTVTFRVLFVLVALAHYRRRVAHFNVTEHPTAAWTAQQIIEAFPEETAPRFLLRDRDQIYGEEFRVDRGGNTEMDIDRSQRQWRTTRSSRHAPRNHGCLCSGRRLQHSRQRHNRIESRRYDHRASAQRRRMDSGARYGPHPAARGWRQSRAVEAGDKDLLFDRVITKINGNQITVDAPICNALDQAYGGGVIYKYEFPARITQVGVENLRGVSEYKGREDEEEEHVWDFIVIDTVANA
jgi:hypothetical protein